MIIRSDARNGKMYILYQGLNYFDVIKIHNQQNAIYDIKQNIRQRCDNVNQFKDRILFRFNNINSTFDLQKIVLLT